MKTVEIRNLIQLLKGYLFFIVFFLLIRLFFFFYFGGTHYLETHTGDILYSFYQGTRYDLIVISYLFLPILLLWLILNFIGIKALQLLYIFGLKFMFIAGALIFLVVEISDLSFYSFFQDHINILFYGLFEDDTSAVLESIWKDYPVGWMLIGVLLFIGGIVFASARLFQFSAVTEKLAWKIKLPLIFVVLILFLGAIRGGYGVMVMSPKYSDFSEVEFINHVAQNGVIALETTYQLRESRLRAGFSLADEMGYRKRIQDAFSDYLGIDTSLTKEDELVNLLWRTTPENKILDNSQPNVIVVLMESFGGSWLQYHSDKFNLLGDLEQHFKQGYYFPNFLPADNGTIGSLMTLATNIPFRRGTRFLPESKYMYLPLETGAHIPYKRRGYETNFFYGGKLSWRNIGRYFKTQAYDVVEGENVIRKNIDSTKKVGNEWGLFDEYLFNYALEKLESRTPQFIFILSTSNHPPYEVPENYDVRALEIPDELDRRINREKELFKERFNAYQYANQQLANFITKIKENHPNTVIAVTGDHNFFGFVTYEKKEVFAKHMVPAFFHFPEKIFKGKVDLEKVGSHEDIMTTLYNKTLSKTQYLTFGEDLFSTEDPVAINSEVRGSKKGIEYRGKYYAWDTKPFIKTDPIETIPEVDIRYRSSVSVSDYYLKFVYDQKRAEAKKDRKE